MAGRGDSALDRFLNEQRVPFVGGPANRGGVLGFGIAAAAQAGVGATLLIASVATGEEPWAAIVGGVLLGVGGALGSVAAWLATPRSTERGGRIRLSREAGELLRGLYQQLDQWGGSRRRRARDLLTPAAFDLLEDAAREYNRTVGALAIAETTGGGGLARLAPGIRAAADEAMVEILHAAALVNRYPESASPQEAQAQARAGELRELADRVEQLQSESAPAPAVEPVSRVREVLEALEHEETARRELRMADEDPQTQALRRSR
jgi:hypothetical protein